MNDTMSLLLATTILAAGGLGLYMYKSSDNNQKGGDDYDEGSLFGSGNLWGSNEDENVEEDYENEEVYEPEPKPRSRGGKTKRRKAGGGTKRRY
jgi:hypothetical protein